LKCVLVETSPSNAAETPAGGQPPAEPSPPKDTPYEDESEGEGEEDDNETCGFCIFMKGGGCKEAFVVSSEVGVAETTSCTPAEFLAGVTVGIS